MKWPQKTIDDTCTLITDGTHYTPPDVGEGAPFLTVKDFTHDGQADFVGCSHITESEFEKAETGNSAPKLGDVLFSKDGTVGKVYVVKLEQRFAVLSSMAILRPDTAMLNADYFGWVLKTDSCLDQASRSKTGSAIRRIILKDLKRVMFPLPPLAEQKRIAAILDAADALRTKRREALAQLDALLQSTFLTLFGDPVENPMGWPMAAMGKQLKVIGGYAFKSEDFQEDGLPVIRISNLNKDSIDLDGCARIPKAKVGKGEKFRIIAGDTLIAMSGATTGKLGLVPDDLQDEWYLNQRVGAFRITGNSQIHREYLRALLASPFYQRHVLNLAGGAAQPNISGAQLESAEIPLPPLPLQQKFAAIVESIKRQKTTQRTYLAELDALFAALQHRAFRGEL